MRGRLRTLGVVAVAHVSVAGCSPSTVTGSPTAARAGKPSTPRGSGTTFDPCTDITDAQVTSYGLDPSTREVSIAQESGLGKGCGWQNKEVLIDFVVSDLTVNDLVRRSRMNTKEISVDGRDSVQFQLEATRGCVIGITSQRTAVVLVLTVAFNSIGKVDPCAAVLAIATKLAPTLPR